MALMTSALRTVFTGRFYQILVSILFFLVLSGFYWLLNQTVTWSDWWAMNANWYNWLQTGLSIFTALLVATSVTMFVYIARQYRARDSSILQTAASLFFSAASTGCYMCGAVLLPTLGLTASLATLPFGGLEVKLLVVGLLIYTMYEYSRKITGACPINNKPLLEKVKGHYRVNLHKHTWQPLLVTSGFVLMVMALPLLPDTWNTMFKEALVQDVQGAYSCSGHDR